MKLSQHLAVFLMFLLFLLSPGSRAETLKRDARMFMGFYAQSITDVASRSDIEISLNFWVKDMLAEESEKINIHFTETKAVLFDNMKDMRDAMLRGELDIITAPPLLISQYFKREELNDGFTGMPEGKKTDYLLLIARSDSNIRSVKDLNGKKLLMLSNDDMADIFVDGLFLKQFSKGYKNIVGLVDHQTKPSRIMLDVFFKKADAGIIYRNSYDIMVELNPELAQNIVILDQYPVKSKNFSFFVSHYPYAAELSDMVVTIFNNSARARQILEVFKTPHLTNCAVRELDEIDKFYSDYMALKGREKK